eukprot:TRINITY_DN7056_c0_g1_i1.p1 TRINITY_DN7056_c0_g1~~TRINITY_DN7056_c0_g1_i1.p1  ORF type:complete len:219 (+),score=47.36 TRINITY_DN7056_c0_g1_i1:158-814(+)
MCIRDSCEAVHKKTGKKVAIKKSVHLFKDFIDCKRILREVQLLRLLRSPNSNVVVLHEIIEPSNLETFDCIYMVMEYAQSDIKKLVKAAIHLQEAHARKLIYNILVGLKYIHSADVLHRDIKPANILINEDCSVRICDFGLARSLVGVEGPSISLMKHKIKMLEEYAAASDDEDVKIKNAELSKIKDSTEEMIDINNQGYTASTPEQKKKKKKKSTLR